MNLFLHRLDTPIGGVIAATNAAERVVSLMFDDHPGRFRASLRDQYADYSLYEAPTPVGLQEPFRRYFLGEVNALRSIEVDCRGTTLQQQVWQLLRDIPAGTTTSYGDIARKLGFSDPRVAIEVGAANASNPVAIIIPCHRVIAKNGDIKGYAWGVHRKRWLLTHEGALESRERPSSPVPLRLPGF